MAQGHYSVQTDKIEAIILRIAMTQTPEVFPDAGMSSWLGAKSPVGGPSRGARLPVFTLQRSLPNCFILIGIGNCSATVSLARCSRCWLERKCDG